MKKSELFTLLDKEKMMQTGVFDHDTEEYKKIYEYLKELKDNDNAEELSENKQKAEVTPNKPLCDFILAVIDALNKDYSNLVSLTQKAHSLSKWQYVLLYASIILELNPLDTFASGAKIHALEKTGADKEELKSEILRYTMHKEDEIKMLLYLSDMFEKDGEKDEAVLTVKRALSRAIKNKSIKDIKDVSDKILKDNSIDLEALVCMFDTTQAKSLDDKFEPSFADIYRAIQKTENYPLIIKGIKLIISTSTKNTKYKTDLVNAYKKLYASSSRLDECLSQSGLEADYPIDLKKAIIDFEKDISIDKGTFVYHNSYGIGRVISATGETIIIDFVTKRKHQMSHKMALSSLTILPKTHIWVLKEFVNKEKLKAKFIEDPRWGVITLLKSEDDSFKLMKKEIVPSILNETEWQTFYQKAKKIVKSDPYISSSPNMPDSYIATDTPVSNNEKIYTAFKHETDLFAKIRLVKDALDAGVSSESECILNMLKFFGMELNSSISSFEYVVSHMFLMFLSTGKQKIKEASAYIKKTDYEIIVRLPANKIPEYFSKIQDPDIRKYFADKIAKFSKEWKEVLTEAYTLLPDASIEKIMEKRGYDSFITDMMKKSFFIVKQNPTLFLYLLKKYSLPEEWKNAGKSTYDLILAQMNVYNSFPGSDRARSVYSNLFDKKMIYQFIDETDDDIILTNLEKNISLSPSLDELKKQEIKHIISTKLEKAGKLVTETPQKEQKRYQGLQCLVSSLEKKKKELEHLITVEIPNNAKDIGEARELGDLRENAEYQYAKDKQKLLNNQMQKLEAELKEAKIVNLDTVDPSSVCFGTVVEIKDEIEDTTFTYTVLGPWESDPDKNIISVTAPAIREIYGAKAGDRLKFNMNGDNKDWTIVSISKYTV